MGSRAGAGWERGVRGEPALAQQIQQGRPPPSKDTHTHTCSRGQATQLCLPWSGAYVPEAHGVHCPRKPTWSEKEPAGHLTHAVRFTSVVPAPQVLHVEEPMEETDPSWHGTHAVLSKLEKVPAGQRLQDPEPAGADCPSGHVKADVEPTGHWDPAGHNTLMSGVGQ